MPGEDERDEECKLSFWYVLGPTFVPALVVFIYFLYSYSEPTYSIQEFYVPALNKDANYTTTTNTIFFDINLMNNDKVKGVLYDPINLTFFYYGPNTSLTPAVGNYIVPAFYQGKHKDTNRRDLVQTHGIPWEAAVGLVSNGSRAMFGVVLTTGVRYSFMNNKSKKFKMVFGAMVEVDYSGEKVGENDIKFVSNETFMSGGASELECRLVCLGLSLFFVVFIFVLL
ncbi:hypothetical protein LguiA_034908 [Lonicera macranthoides]